MDVGVYSWDRGRWGPREITLGRIGINNRVAPQSPSVPSTVGHVL